MSGNQYPLKPIRWNCVPGENGRLSERLLEFPLFFAPQKLSWGTFGALYN